MTTHKIKNSIFIIIGLLICIYILYIRIIRENIPRDLYTNLYLNGHFLQLSLYLMLIIIFIFLITQNIKKIEKKNLKLQFYPKN